MILVPRRATVRRPQRQAVISRTHPAGTTYSNSVTNLGDLETFDFTITVTGPQAPASLFFENVTQGKTLWVNLAVGAGQTLVINFLTRTVTVNSVTQSGVIADGSRWWGLSPGANTVRMNVTATLDHRAAYSA